MLWFSVPTNLNRGFLNDGVIQEKYNEAINLDFQSAFMLPFWMMNTPRSCFPNGFRLVKAVRTLLDSVCCLTVVF